MYELFENTGDHPVDVNEDVEKIMKKFKSPELLVAMEDGRKGKLFGDLVFSDPITKLPFASLRFVYGICKEYKLIKYYGSDVVFQRSIKNRKVKFNRSAK